MEKFPQWKKLISEQDINFFVQKVANHLNEKYEFANREIVMVCILKGAAYFFVDLTRKCTFQPSQYYLEVSSYKEGQIQDKIDILSILQPSKLTGKIVVIIDELFDNGDTILNVRDEVHKHANVPYEDIYTCTLFKKRKDTKTRPDYYGVLVPDVWLVGYGLDHIQKFRELTDLYACPKDDHLSKTEDDLNILNSFNHKNKADSNKLLLYLTNNNL
jgi:hypoxanthine phosphoribosyltransferase